MFLSIFFQINQNQFPCHKKLYNYWELKEQEFKIDHVYKLAKYECELYQDRYVIIPVHDDHGHCTAIFDIETKKWKKLKHDIRTGNGSLVKTYDRDKILFLGREDGKVWEFRGIDSGWFDVRGIQVPMKIAQNGTKIITLHPDFCNRN